jgi:hypothetical protein
VAKKVRKQKRDELGRFAKVRKPTLWRDQLGRFAPAKKPARKPVKKVSPPVRLRVSPAKARPKKAAPARAKPQPKKVSPAKSRPQSKKVAPVKARTKKPDRATVKEKSRPKKVETVKAKPQPKKVVPVKGKPKKPAKSAPKKPRKKPVKVPPRKPGKRPAAKKPPARRPPAKKKPPRRRRRRGELPLLAERSRQAEAIMQERLVQLQDGVAMVQPGLDMAIQTFINLDGTVDGELRISSLPDEWREVDGVGGLVATLSSALRTFDPFPPRPAMGGAFWAAFGIRFGPQNETEVGELADLYKRFRGLFQIGTYPTPAWSTGPLQLALVGDTVGLRAMIVSLMEKRGLPATVILVRFIWTPDGKRPGHYEGEK